MDGLQDVIKILCRHMHVHVSMYGVVPWHLHGVTYHTLHGAFVGQGLWPIFDFAVEPHFIYTLMM